VGHFLKNSRGVCVSIMKKFLKTDPTDSNRPEPSRTVPIFHKKIDSFNIQFKHIFKILENRKTHFSFVNLIQNRYYFFKFWILSLNHARAGGSPVRTDRLNRLIVPYRPVPTRTDPYRPVCIFIKKKCANADFLKK